MKFKIIFFILKMIVTEVHRECMKRCFQEINEHLIWDNNVCLYRNVESYMNGEDYASANYRDVYKSSRDDLHYVGEWEIHNIWSGYRVECDLQVPKNYYNNEVCHVDFIREWLLRKNPDIEKYKEDYLTYEQFLSKMMRWVMKLEKDFDFDYTEGNPLEQYIRLIKERKVELY